LDSAPFQENYCNDNTEPPGFVYVAHLDGFILECGEEWSAFALQNGAAELASGRGLNVFSCCSDPETRSIYQLIHSLLMSGKLDSYTFNFRCDGPDRIRLFRMRMIRYPYSENAVLYWAQLLMTKARPPVRLIASQSTRGLNSRRAVKLCSFCQKVWDHASKSWSEAAAHPQADDDTVPIMHGVCGNCHDAIAAPLIRVLQGTS
jgi:hypothetical protein